MLVVTFKLRIDWHQMNAIHIIYGKFRSILCTLFMFLTFKWPFGVQLIFMCCCNIFYICYSLCSHFYWKWPANVARIKLNCAGNVLCLFFELWFWCHFPLLITTLQLFAVIHGWKTFQGYLNNVCSPITQRLCPCNASQLIQPSVAKRLEFYTRGVQPCLK